MTNDIQQDQPATGNLTTAHAEAIISDILASAVDGAPADATTDSILDAISGGNGHGIHMLLLMAAAGGFTAGWASQAPVEGRTMLLANTLRATHRPEMFGDCTEDGDHFPCRTIRAVNIVVGAPDEEPLVTPDDFATS